MTAAPCSAQSLRVARSHYVTSSTVSTPSVLRPMRSGWSAAEHAVRAVASDEGRCDRPARTWGAPRTTKRPALGAAMLAGVGAGTFSDLDEAVAALTVLDPAVYDPDHATTADL